MTSKQFPDFKIIPSDVPSIYRGLMQKLKKAYEELKLIESPVFSSFESIEEISQEIELFSSEISHLMHVNSVDKTLSDIYESMIPELTKFYSEIGQDEDIYQVFFKISKTNLSDIEKRVIDREILGFKHSGIGLEKEKQNRLIEISQRTSLLSTRFSNNITESVDETNIDLKDDSRLKGINEIDINRFKEQAKDIEAVEYRISTTVSDIYAVLDYAEDSELRKEAYMNINTVASTGKKDNTGIMKEILELRQEKSLILGYSNYAEYSLSTKMAETPEQVINFLEDLTQKASNQEKEESLSFRKYSFDNGYTNSIEDYPKPWNASIINRLKEEEEFNIDNNEIKKYFPMKKVQSGLFWVIKSLFGYQLSPVDFEYEKYNDQLELFKIEKDNKLIAYIYGDFYSRAGKDGGAWMSDYRARDEGVVPVAFVTCNFPSPSSEQDALLSFDEVETIFHEFGHALHHTLTTVDVIGAEGLSGVPWDAIELPSTLMEFFCSNPEVLSKISGHFETGEIMPSEMVDSLIKHKNYNAASNIIRQMEFSLADMIAHTKNITDIESVAEEFKKRNDLKPKTEGTFFYNRFSHIFSGGYAAGYYSYKWADILASDIFQTFEDNGVICKETGERYLKTILTQGSSSEIMDMFREFKGADPSPVAFLKYSGIKVV